MTVIAVATIGMLALLTLVIGLLFAFTPYLMRRTECFAVTVPASPRGTRASSCSRGATPW